MLKFLYKLFLRENFCILLIIKDYGPAAAALLSIIAVIVVFVVNS